MLTVIVRSVFEENGKYCLQVFLDECLNDLQMLEYDRIGISVEIDINKTNASKKCDICHYWYSLNKVFKYECYSIEKYLRLNNGCYELMLKATNFNDVAIVSVKGSDYRTHFWHMNKADATNVMKNANLNEKQ